MGMEHGLVGLLVSEEIKILNSLRTMKMGLDPQTWLYWQGATYYC